MNLKKIPVDLEVFKALEARRETFQESHNDILRRVFGLPQKVASPEEEAVVWLRKGVGLPEGTRWRMTSAKGDQTGNVVEGGFQYRGEVVASPSSLAMQIHHAKSGKKTNLNGWRYIEVKRPGDDEWMMLSSLVERPLGH
jgi:hypothetical protein